MNKDHYDEQMEALKSDFEKVWTLHIEPYVKEMNVNQQTLAAFKNISWIAFRYGKVK